MLLETLEENLLPCLCQLLGPACTSWLVAPFLRLEGQQNSMFQSLPLTSAHTLSFLSPFSTHQVTDATRLHHRDTIPLCCLPCDQLYPSLSSHLFSHQVLVATDPALNYCCFHLDNLSFYAPPLSS